MTYEQAVEAIQAGAQVNLLRGNCWNLDAGRYTLHNANPDPYFGRPMWELVPNGAATGLAVSAHCLAREIREGRVMQIDPAIVERERQELFLRAASPLRPLARATHDVDGLALFDHARQPALAL